MPGNFFSGDLKTARSYLIGRHPPYIRCYFLMITYIIKKINNIV